LSVLTKQNSSNISSISDEHLCVPIVVDERRRFLEERIRLKPLINVMRASMNHDVLRTLGVTPLTDIRLVNKIVRARRCCGTLFYRYGENSGCEYIGCTYDTECANKLTLLMAEYAELLGDDEEEIHDDDFHYIPYVDEDDSKEDDSKEDDSEEGIGIRLKDTPGRRSNTAINGDLKRRKTEEVYSELDRQLNENMGNSYRCYSVTKSYKPRKEYYGK